jgi:Mn-containing catalase
MRTGTDLQFVWTNNEQRMYAKHISKNIVGVMPITLRGTTFSGDPITTIGNTLRTIFYYKYYL